MTSSPSFLSDNETKVDLLNAEAIATTIIKVLRERPDKPVTIGVHGDWGAGKSSVLEMIEAGLEKEEDILCLKFNGWRFQGFEDAKIALIEGIVTDLLEKRPKLKKVEGAVKEVFDRIDWMKVAKSLGGLAVTAYTGVPTPAMIQTAMGTLEKFTGDPAQIFSKENVQAAVAGVKSTLALKPASDSKNIPNEIQEFRKAFDKLLTEAKIKQLVVLVDDLDRCLPDTAIETLEAIRLFVFTSKTAFVIAADEAMIEYAVRKHFPELPDTSGPQTYARNYLEKLIQVPFRIPSLGETETRIYVTLLLVGAELGDEDSNFNKLIAVARERLKRPWTRNIIDAGVIKTALGGKDSQAQDALALSDQIAPILASGTKGNPRQIKRFINTILLRQRTAEARGFGAEVKLPILAKLLLAERYLPHLYDQIASIAAISSDGKCADLSSLEAVSKEGAANPKSVTKPSPTGTVTKDTASAKDIKKPESGMLAEWLSAPSIIAWSKISPALAETDLRPYLFVAKERKDYFGGSSVLGHLAALAEKLFGPKLAVQGLDAELKRLNAVEAAQVFEAVRGRIMAAGALDPQPDGIEGITVLVKAHSSLQSNLLDFLENMPTARIGAWVVSGWAGVITDAAAAKRFGALLQAWMIVTDNSKLKAAATAAAALRTKGSR